MVDAAPLVRRGRRNADYTAIANCLIDHPCLGPEARTALIYLLSKPDDWRLQIADIGKLLGSGGQAVWTQRGLRGCARAEGERACRRARGAPRGTIHRVTYFVFDEPVGDLTEIDADLSVEVAFPPPPAIDAEPLTQPCPQNRDKVRYGVERSSAEVEEV